MSSRRQAIIALADISAGSLIDALPLNRPRAIANNRSIQAVSKALLLRRTPLLPSAPLVADEGGISNPDFPKAQTIYNEYREMLNIWRSAYQDLRTIDSEDRLSPTSALTVDTSGMDAGDRHNVEQLQRVIKEQLGQINGLRKLILDHVPVSLDANPPEDNAFIAQLRRWLDVVQRSGFRLDDFGLRLTRLVQPGSMVMEIELFHGLQKLVAEADKRSATASATKSKK